MSKINNINLYKIMIYFHPVTNQPVNLKWYRGANRFTIMAQRDMDESINLHTHSVYIK